VNSSHFYRNYGLTCEKIGKTLEAVNYLLQSIKLAPMEPVNYIELIRLYLAHDRFMEAYSMVQLAKKNVPFSITLSMLYNQIMDKVNRSKKS
jgi:tetratricopeptide (TPR) repeat protein